MTGEPVTEARLRPGEVHDIIRRHLHRLVGLWGLRSGDVRYLTQVMRTHTYAPGELVLPHQVRADFLGLIVRGQVAVYDGQHRAGRQVAILLPGSTFGSIAPDENPSTEISLQALTRCDIRFLSSTDLEALVKKRRSERWVAAIGRVLTWVALALILCLALLLLLRVSPVRRAAALLPMGLGEWCGQQARASGGTTSYERCAEWAWMTAAELASSDANPYLALGAFYFERGELEAAEKALGIAETLAPDLAEVQNNLGMVYARQGLHHRAIEAFQEAQELEPGTAAIEHNLGLSLQAVGAHDEALIHYQLALAYGEPQTSTLVNLAIAYYETGQPDQAADIAQQVLDADATATGAHTVLGAMAIDAGQPEAAVSHLERAIELDGGYGQAFFFLGMAHKMLDQPAEAIVALEQALVLTEDATMRPRIRDYLEELYAVGGQDGAHR